MKNTNDLLNTKTGSNEQPKNTVKPAKVTIASVIIKTKDKHDKLMGSPLAQFMVKHPDKDELLNISKVKYLDGDKAIAKGFWISVDEDESFYKGSTVDLILEKLGCETLADTYGKEIDTVEESKDSPYLCLKAY